MSDLGARTPYRRPLGNVGVLALASRVHAGGLLVLERWMTSVKAAPLQPGHVLRTGGPLRAGPYLLRLVRQIHLAHPPTVLA
ncbi:MAG TPA: hypothetical protein VGR26_13895 [Acidimicrobiales bacterium]|nr:hypothetical protein [Acidimicrobiales bacterium]